MKIPLRLKQAIQEKLNKSDDALVAPSPPKVAEKKNEEQK